MKPRFVLALAVTGAMLAIAALAHQNKPPLLILDWAAKAGQDTPTIAVLIELGIKDAQPTSWSGRARVTGARVVRREGYRFREGDKLVDLDGWEASSHRPLRLPKNQPAVAKMEGISTVGIVLQLVELQPGAVLKLEPRDKEFEPVAIPLDEAITGKARYFANEHGLVRRISVASQVALTQTEDDFPAAAYGPDGTLWVAYISYTLKEESRRIETTPIKSAPANFQAYNTPEFGDQVFVKSYRDGKWSEAIPIAPGKQDLMRCAIAVDKDGVVEVAYSANRDGNFDIFTRSINPGRPAPLLQPEQKRSDSDGPDLHPVMCTDSAGLVQLAWRAVLPDGRSQLKINSPTQGRATTFFQQKSLIWHPSLAAGVGNRLICSYDEYSENDYDISLYDIRGPAENRTEGKGLRIASSSLYEARPSVAYDASGRLWIAYEEGPVRWGKDSGALAKGGNPLFSDRSVRVVCLDTDGKLKRPVAELPTSAVGNPGSQTAPAVTNQNERATRYSYPQIGIDGKGRVWLTYRQNFGSRYTTHPGNYCLSFARRLDGDRWTEPMELHHSDGFLDSRPVLLPHASGGLMVIHNSDGRHTTPETLHNQIFMSIVDLPGDPAEPKLVPHNPGKKDPAIAAETLKEMEAVKRIRDYRVELAGKKYQPLRGEFHRHTEISWDGAADGSLEDMFRYAIDAAAMDWIGNGDHDSGAGREYPWWLIQKLTDAYHVPHVFTPMFTYERSVGYPHGHRNCVFAKRGIRTLPRLAPEPGQAVGGAHADDTKMLYRYLKELDGICAGHTSATGMGTDWRDNDPLVEPIVEIYQGDRMSYEYQGAPRSGYDPKSGKTPFNIGGWFPAGFINLALKDKGYRLGFQASSDHWSTHISYCIVLAERHDREAILDAMKRRHCYGATDNVILDIQSGSHMMGDEFKTSEAPTLKIAVIGTGPIAQIDILKDSEIVQTFKPATQRFERTWTDPSPSAGVHYYYVRVQQADDELAWGSPMWIDYVK